MVFLESLAGCFIEIARGGAAGGTTGDTLVSEVDLRGDICELEFGVCLHHSVFASRAGDPASALFFEGEIVAKSALRCRGR